MKKSVRIRKALPGEKPGYYNKTAKFLQKAQMGMEVDSPSMDSQRMNQIYTHVYQSLKRSMVPDIVYNELITEFALDQQTSLNIIQFALKKLVDEGYIDPEITGSNKKEEQEQDPNVEKDQQQIAETDQRASEDAEQEELAMSDEGYYDEEEALNNDTSHLEDEESQQQEAFRYGGYMNNGGEYDEYLEDEYLENEDTDEGEILEQYNNKGIEKRQKPFSIQDLMAATPGMQGQEAFPDLSYYLGDYGPISDSYQPMDYLPTAQRGGPPDGLNFLQRMIKPISSGLNTFRKNNPMSNSSGLKKTLPVFSTIGQGVRKIPYIGSKLKPKLETTFTQNRYALWDILNGAEPKNGLFSQSGTHDGGADGSLSVNNLLLYQDDVMNIIENIQNGRSTFVLNDISPNAEYDGLVSGVYPMDAKVIAGTDDNGAKFFELKHTFGPNQRLPFGTTPAKAKEVTVKNRFYFNTDATTGEVKVFDQVGNPLSIGNKTKYEITRPLGTSMSRIGKYFTTDAGLLETNTYDKSLTGYEYGFPYKGSDGARMSLDENTPIYDDEGNIINNEITTSYLDVDRYPQYSVTGQFGTPYPNYMGGMWPADKGFLGNTMGRLNEVSDIAPATQNTLGFFGNIGRGLENAALSTWLPQLVGLGNPIRTAARNVNKLALPTFGYRNASLGPGVNPAQEGSYGQDIKNAVNYNARLGLKASLIGLGIPYLGYKTWDAIANPCQCVDETKPNYQPVDSFGKCTCGNIEGNKRILDPTGVQNEEYVKPTALPDSMKFLRDHFGVAPTPENYWQYRDSLDLLKSKESFPNDFSKGGISKKQFIKKFISKFEEGGDTKNSTIGKGSRLDNLTSDVKQTKDLLKNKLKTNSNIAITEQIYKNAQSNPEILNMLMQSGPKENLAEDSKMEEEMPTGQYGYETEVGGFVDSDAEEPLYKFIYGGDEAEYYEPYDLPMAGGGGINNQTNGNCPAGYKWDGTKWCIAENETQTKCGPGKVWNATYNTCVTKSKITLNPIAVRGRSGLLNNIIPFNAIISSAGSWLKQKSNPYYLNSRNPYTGELTGAPIASYITKRGIFGRPKRSIDIYNTGSDGVNLSELEQLMEQNKRGNRNQSNKGNNNSNKNNNNSNKNNNKLSNGEQLEDDIKKRYDMSDEEWESTDRRGKRRERRAERYLQGRGMRYNIDQFAQNKSEELQNIKYGFLQGRPEKKSKKQYGGYLNQYSPGGINDPNTNPGIGVLKNSGLVEGTPGSRDSWGGVRAAMNPNIPFVANPGASIKQMMGLDTESMKSFTNPDGTPKKQSNLVGVENKIKNMTNVDFESSALAFNALSKGALNLFDPNKKTQCGPGTVWNSNSKTCQPVDSMDLMAAEDQQDRGDWQDFGSKSGMFRYDQEGQDRSSRATYGQYGGYMQEGGFYNPLFEEDEEVYMSPEELEQFLQAGGQVEYL